MHCRKIPLTGVWRWRGARDRKGYGVGRGGRIKGKRKKERERKQAGFYGLSLFVSIIIANTY